MEIKKNILLSDFSTFAVGGPADFFVEIFTEKDLKEALDFAESQKIPKLFLGGGSNSLFLDRGFRGLILFFQNKKIIFQEGKIIAESGATNAEIFQFAKGKGRDYSAFLTVPGTIGGAVFGNAGTPAAEIGAVVSSADLFDAEKREMFHVEKNFFDFDYRKSILRDYPGIVVWRVFLDLPEKDPKDIENFARKFVAQRKEKQPWGKTGGSFFKNPSEGAAGFFLEKAGFRGKKEGHAFFSGLHANFMMNDGGATQAEIVNLARMAKKSVFEKFGVELHNEVRVFDEFGEKIEI